MTTQQPTVFIVDDDPSIRRVLGELFDTQGMPWETYASAQEFLDRLDTTRTGCLLLDVRMPGSSGLELQEELAQRGIDIPIVFMTAYADVPMSVRAMKGGAVDFVEKPFNEQLLLEAIHRAMVTDTHARELSEDTDVILRRVQSLTHRERQVLELVVSGLSNPEIARQWRISEKTVKIHRARVMEKMQAKSLPQLVIMAQSAGICTPKALSE